MPRRRIGQETMFGAGEKRWSLDELVELIDWAPIERRLEFIYSAPRGEASWPPLSMFRGMLLAVWYDLSDVKLADALDDRASFRRFCGFARTEPTPDRTAFVRFRRELLRHGLDQVLFDEITAQLKTKTIRVKTGTLVDATVAGSASEGAGDARWPGHRSRKAIHGYKAHVGAPYHARSGPIRRWWKKSRSRQATLMTAATARSRCRTIQVTPLPTAPIGGSISRSGARPRRHAACRGDPCLGQEPGRS